MDDPFLVNLKRCNGGEFCHGQLNRCAMDPYIEFKNQRNPGVFCSFNYECKSQLCSDQGRCIAHVEDPSVYEISCKSHADCNVGYFCGAADHPDKQPATEGLISSDSLN